MFKSVVVCNGILHCSSFAAEDIDLMLSNQPNPHSGGPLLKNSKCWPLYIVDASQQILPRNRAS